MIATAAGDNIGIASIAERARGFGAKVILLTMLKDSLCARNSDYTVIIPGIPMRREALEYRYSLEAQSLNKAC